MFDFNFGFDEPFGAYAMHTSECDNLVDEIVNNYYLTGETSFNVAADGLTQYDLDYIKSSVEERLGI